jgi:hypothetical protein
MIKENKVLSPIKLVVMALTDYNINGEELETLIRDLGMEDQMLRQLVMKADIDVVNELIREKEELEMINETKVHNIVSFTTVNIYLTYKEIKYSVEIRYYNDNDIDYIVSDSVTGDKLHSKDPIVDEIITYIEENVDLAN